MMRKAKQIQDRALANTRFVYFVRHKIKRHKVLFAWLICTRLVLEVSMDL